MSREYYFVPFACPSLRLPPGAHDSSGGCPERLRYEGECKKYAEKMLGESLVTKQTGPEGKPVNHVFLMERLYMRREMYVDELRWGRAFFIYIQVYTMVPVSIIVQFTGVTSCGELFGSAPTVYSEE